MTDACVVTRKTGSVTDPVTGHRTVTTVTVYSGRCRIQELLAFSRDVQPAPDQPQLARYRVLQLPVVGSEDVRAGDDVVMTAAPNDPDAVGLALVVRDQSSKSEATSRRVGVEQVTG